MASGSLNFKEKFVTCPYNEAHSIDPLRMPKHLIKCRKQYPNVKMSICPFNATHHVREEKLPAHISECKDKAIVEKDLFLRENPEILSNTIIIQRETVEPQNSRTVESWDSETVDISSYNSEASIIYKEIPRQAPTGLGKAGRKLWREVDIERIKRLREGKPIGDLVYPTAGGGEISINDITREHSNNFDLSEFKNYLLEKNSNCSKSSPRKPKELPELPRPKNFQKNVFPSKYSDTESEASDTSFSLRKITSVGKDNGIDPRVEGGYGQLTGMVNAMNISKEMDCNSAENNQVGGQRNVSIANAHRMLLRHFK